MKQCAIMGNGESLNDMPEETLLQMDSFGVNYCKYQPTFYVCVDTDILMNSWTSIYPVASQAKAAYLSLKHDGSSPLYFMPNVQMVTHDKGAFLGEHYFSGLTVTYVALKMAYYLGYEEVHLWGVDHSPTWKHYKDNYPPGDTDRRAWRMAEMEFHYQLAQKVYNQAGRRIINHSHPSKLDAIFQR